MWLHFVHDVLERWAPEPLDHRQVKSFVIDVHVIRPGEDVTAGVGHTTPHDLRRTFGSLARLGGADLRYVQKAMGHASITTTSRIYAHLYNTEPDQVAQGIDRVMNEGLGPSETRQNTL